MSLTDIFSSWGKSIYCSTVSISGTIPNLLFAKHCKDHIERKYGVKNGETSEDGAFTLVCFECLGHCSTAPMMLVDEEKYENLTPESLDEVLGALS